MDIHNARLSNSTELFLSNILETAVEKSSRALHDKAICKAVSQDKPQQKSAKSSIFHSYLGSSSSSSLSVPLGRLRGSVLSIRRLPFPCCPPKLLPFLSVVGRVRNLRVPCLPHSCRWEAYSGGIGIFNTHGLYKSQVKYNAKKKNRSTEGAVEFHGGSHVSVHTCPVGLYSHLDQTLGKPVNGMVGLVFACHLGGANSILGHSIEGSEVCISGDRSLLSTWFGSHVKLLVPLLNNHWFHAT